jgi:glutamyl-Q tRNA(Asp) synthetase
MNIKEITRKISGPIRTRFAPSPTGQLHMGHVASAIYVWGIAQKLKAQVIVRIEDHDGARSKNIYEKSILEDLDWLGFLNAEETFQITRQRDSTDHYKNYLNRLTANNLVYPCTCSRKKIKLRQEKKFKELYYNGNCRSESFLGNLDCTLRLKTNSEPQAFWDLKKGQVTQNLSQQCGDFAIRDQKNYWTYQYSSTVDDIKSKINLVIRGLDLIESTGRQVYLRSMLNEKSESVYLHHPLIWDDSSGFKLSKGDKSKPISFFRESKRKASWVLGQAAFLVGLCKEPRDLSYADLKSLFNA